MITIVKRVDQIIPDFTEDDLNDGTLIAATISNIDNKINSIGSVFKYRNIRFSLAYLYRASSSIEFDAIVYTTDLMESL